MAAVESQCFLMIHFLNPTAPADAFLALPADHEGKGRESIPFYNPQSYREIRIAPMDALLESLGLLGDCSGSGCQLAQSHCDAQAPRSAVASAESFTEPWLLPADL